jgi:hypothetical protein
VFTASGIVPRAKRKLEANQPPTKCQGGSEMKRFSILLMGLCLFAVTFAQLAMAQKAVNVTGNWDVTVKLPAGNVTEKWTVRQTGEKVTGTVKDAQGERPVEGALVDKIFFRVSVKVADSEQLIRATADENSMDGSITIGRKEYLWSARRSK